MMKDKIMQQELGKTSGFIIMNPVAKMTGEDNGLTLSIH